MTTCIINTRRPAVDGQHPAPVGRFDPLLMRFHPSQLVQDFVRPLRAQGQRKALAWGHQSKSRRIQGTSGKHHKGGHSNQAGALIDLRHAFLAQCQSKINGIAHSAEVLKCGNLFHD